MKKSILIIVLIMAFIINSCGASTSVFKKEDSRVLKKREAIKIINVLGTTGGRIYNLYGYWINDSIRFKINMVIGIMVGDIKIDSKTISDSTGTYSRSYSTGNLSPYEYTEVFKKIIGDIDYDGNIIISNFEIDTYTKVVLETF